MKKDEISNISIVVDALMQIGPSTVIDIVDFLKGRLTRKQVQSAVVKQIHILNTGENVTINKHRNSIYTARNYHNLKAEIMNLRNKSWFLSK